MKTDLANDREPPCVATDISDAAGVAAGGEATAQRAFCAVNFVEIRRSGRQKSRFIGVWKAIANFVEIKI
jgi:hypothetical protein